MAPSQIEAWLAARQLSTPSEEQILEVVKANYDSLTLKLQVKAMSVVMGFRFRLVQSDSPKAVPDVKTEENQYENKRSVSLRLWPMAHGSEVRFDPRLGICGLNQVSHDHRVLSMKYLHKIFMIFDPLPPLSAFGDEI